MDNAKHKLRTLTTRGRVVLKPELRTIEFLTSDTSIFELPPSYQRWYEAWAPKRVDSYILDVHDSLGVKDLFLIADIEQILKNSDSSDPEYDYFEDLWEQGRRFIIIDGQHRFNTVNYYIHGAIGDEPKPPEPHRIGSGRQTDYMIDDINVSVNGKTYDELPIEIKDYFRSREIVITFIERCNLAELKALFVKSNSGTPLTKQEKRAAANSPVASYIQDWFGPKGNRDWISMLDKSLSGIQGDWRKVKRGYELIGAEFLDWEHHPTTMVDHTSLDTLYNVDDSELWDFNKKKTKGQEAKRWESNMKIMVDGMKTIKGVKLGAFRDFYYFTSVMTNPKHPYYETNTGDKVKIKNSKVWCETLWIIYQELYKEENNWVLKPNEPKHDADGNVNFLPHPSTGKPMMTGGCFRGLHGTNGPEQIKLRVWLFKEEFEKNYKSKLVNSGAITYLDGNRTFTKPQKLGKLVSNNMRDGLTNELITVAQATTPGRLHGDHVKRYVDGGETSNANLAVTLSENNLKKG